METATEEEQAVSLSTQFCLQLILERFGKCGSQREEADRVSYYRHRFPVVVHLEEDGMRNGMSTLKSERVIHSLLEGFVQEDGMSLL